MAKPLHRILYVEDEKDIQTVAKFALEMVGGLEVVVCNSGQEAIERAPHAAPDLILLDVMMPELAQTPVVFMTAKVQAQEVERYRQMGAAEVISKPFDPMTLAATVREIWDRIHDS
jgi:two-component system OmpR family response regulator